MDWDSEYGESSILNVPFRDFDESLLVVKEVGLGILEVFFQLVDGRLMLLGLDADLLLIALMTAVQSFNEGINNGVEHGWIQVGGGDCITYQFR